MVDIIPAILTDDLVVLKKQIKQAKAFCRSAQVDILDQTLVSGRTVLPKDFEDFGEVFLEAHLMVDHPIAYIDDLKRACFDRVVFHFESKDDPEKTIIKIKNCGFEVGIALNPDTSVPSIGKLSELVDEILLLSVDPGQQGQDFQDQVLGKVAEIKDLYPDVLVGIDGGINDKNALLLERIGANIIYVGHYFWSEDNPEKALKELILALNK